MEFIFQFLFVLIPFSIFIYFVAEFICRAGREKSKLIYFICKFWYFFAFAVPAITFGYLVWLGDYVAEGSRIIANCNCQEALQWLISSIGKSICLGIGSGTLSSIIIFSCKIDYCIVKSFLHRLNILKNVTIVIMAFSVFIGVLYGFRNEIAYFSIINSGQL